MGRKCAAAAATRPAVPLLLCVFLEPGGAQLHNVACGRWVHARLAPDQKAYGGGESECGRIPLGRSATADCSCPGLSATTFWGSVRPWLALQLALPSEECELVEGQAALQHCCSP